jgi:Rieske Fe-S protein
MGAAASQPADAPAVPAGSVDAGHVDQYAKRGIYDRFRNQGFVIVRRDDEQLLAISSVCTHKNCKVRAGDQTTIRCGCHGSTFDSGGKVTRGPAKSDLERLRITQDTRKHVLVHVRDSA